MRAARYLLIALAMLPVAGNHVDAKGDRQGAPYPGEAAVGRLIVAGDAMCTGALVSPDLVLTAAHCLYDTRSGRRVDPETIEFQAGLRAGKALAVRRVVSATQHPDYQHRRRGEAQLGHDLALLRLSSPLPRGMVLPMASDRGLERGDMLAVLSYTLGHRDAPLLEYPCQVVAHQFETVVMSCEVDYGASGAPVLAFNQGGPSVVSVVSAKAAMNGRNVSVGTTLSSATLRRMMQ